jgi:3-ketosteroid 9alpha-monooxygenase subunit B
MSDSAARTAAPRSALIETRVLESIVETADTRTLVLEAGVHVGDWQAGQYVTVDPHQFPGLSSFVAYLESVKGRHEPPRAYSMCSAPFEPHLAITIKEEIFQAGQTKYPPLLSGYLVHQVRAGDSLVVRGFAGAYILPPDVERKVDHVLHLVAGSGSVPNVSMVKDSLRHHSRLRHTFVYSNKTLDDVIFRDALTALQAAHPDRLRVVHTLTRQQGPLDTQAGYRTGRVDEDLLRGILAEHPDSLVYACGPAISVWERRAAQAEARTPAPRFLETMLAQLAALGVDRHRISVEAFG